jgi:hypothetical protein
VIWSGWVKSNDVVTVQLCKFAKNNAVLTAPLTFNVRVLTGSTPSAAATLTVPAGSGIATGTCLTTGVNVAGATPSSAIVLSPASDPGAVGWNGTIPEGFSDAPGHVVGQFCQFAGGSAPASAALNYNIAVLN